MGDDLPGLFLPGGALYEAADKTHGQPLWTSTTAMVALHAMKQRRRPVDDSVAGRDKEKNTEEEKDTKEEKDNKDKDKDKDKEEDDKENSVSQPEVDATPTTQLIPREETPKKQETPTGEEMPDIIEDTPEVGRRMPVTERQPSSLALKQLRPKDVNVNDLDLDIDSHLDPFEQSSSPRFEFRLDQDADQPEEDKADKSMEYVDISDNDNHNNNHNIDDTSHLRSKALTQLTSNAWLSDDVMYLLQQQLVDRALSEAPQNTTTTASSLLDPLFFRSSHKDSYLLPRAIGQKQGRFLLACIHHESPGHWTQAAIDTQGKRIEWYDPLPGQHRTEEVRGKLREWTRRVFDGEPYAFVAVPGPQQSDTFSCGPFALQALDCRLRGLPFPSSWHPSDTRRRLASLVATSLQQSLSVEEKVSECNAIRDKNGSQVTRRNSAADSIVNVPESASNSSPLPRLNHDDADQSIRKRDDKSGQVPTAFDNSHQSLNPVEKLPLHPPVSSPQEQPQQQQSENGQSRSPSPSSKRPREDELNPVESALSPKRQKGCHSTMTADEALASAHAELRRQSEIMASLNQSLRNSVVNVPQFDLDQLVDTLKDELASLGRLRQEDVVLEQQANVALAELQKLKIKYADLERRKCTMKRLLGPTQSLATNASPDDQTVLQIDAEARQAVDSLTSMADSIINTITINIQATAQIMAQAQQAADTTVQARNAMSKKVEEAKTKVHRVQAQMAFQRERNRLSLRVFEYQVRLKGAEWRVDEGKES
ncbi:hypothetical protein QQZ08_004603 [Neonectria magnoliae]|uniref:Ubiquitin-like protease family profile domain-containing protein n=1 Tax=Neonectria magnoliae TaxID=2732573 RepID=A0ABR1I5J0_9HYPO